MPCVSMSSVITTRFLVMIAMTWHKAASLPDRIPPTRDSKDTPLSSQIFLRRHWPHIPRMPVFTAGRRPISRIPSWGVLRSRGVNTAADGTRHYRACGIPSPQTRDVTGLSWTGLSSSRRPSAKTNWRKQIGVKTNPACSGTGIKAWNEYISSHDFLPIVSCFG